MWGEITLSEMGTQMTVKTGETYIVKENANAA